METVARIVRECDWIPSVPEIPQLRFLAAPEREVLYGGQAGGGKSEAQLMDAALYVDYPEYSALILRQTFADLALPGALMDRGAEWFSRSNARWNERDKTWTFPSGATITFGYLDGPRDHLRYQGAAFHRILIDESTQIRESQIRYMFSRLRRDANSRVPIAMRLASNPGGESHAYHLENFVSPREFSPDKRYIPAGLEDNPYLDTEEYERTLENLDETTYRQLRHGEWIEHAEQIIFRREWWQGQNRYDGTDPRLARKALARFAAFDTANKLDEDNAYTVCVVAELDQDYRLRIVDVQRERLSFPDLPEWTLLTLRKHAQDLKLKGVWIEEAASGIQLLQVLGKSAPAWLRNILWASRPIKSKQERWNAAALWCKRGCVLLPEPSAAVPWLYEMEQELFSVPNSRFLDQADAFSQLINELEEHQGVLSEGWAARTSVGVA